MPIVDEAAHLQPNEVPAELHAATHLPQPPPSNAHLLDEAEAPTPAPGTLEAAATTGDCCSQETTTTPGQDPPGTALMSDQRTPYGMNMPLPLLTASVGL